MKLLALFLSFFGAIAAANSAAPIEIKAAPSSALRGRVTGLEVSSETLLFDCHFAYCDVQATYRLSSETDKELQFRFLLPTNGKVKPSLDGKAWNESPAEKMKDGTLYEARFAGKLSEGTHELAVSYVQPLHMHVNRGYVLSRAHGDYSFTYLLKPLKEWKRAESFSLRILVKWDLPARGAFRKFFASGKRDIECYYGSFTPASEQADLMETSSGERQVFEAKFVGDFPDTLVCQGDVSPELNRVFDGNLFTLEERFVEAQKKLVGRP